MVRHLKIDAVNPDTKPITEAARLIQQGGLVILPTDTAYGLAANPTDAAVVHRIQEVKGRTSKQGMPLLAANIDQVRAITILEENAEALAKTFWPGGLTLILFTRQRFPEGVIGPANTLAVRVPDHLVALEVIHHTGFAITGTSANRSDAPSPRTAEAAIQQIGDQVDLILDAGPTYHAADSTILNCTLHPPQIIRQGAIPVEKLHRWLTGP